MGEHGVAGSLVIQSSGTMHSNHVYGQCVGYFLRREFSHLLASQSGSVTSK